MASIAQINILNPLTIRSLASARQTLVTSPILSQAFSRNMSSHPDKKNPKFGHLPLSTSGPEECALTVINAHTFSLPDPLDPPD